jgi:hypothetical protein
VPSQQVFELVGEALDQGDQGVRDPRFLDDDVSREFACWGFVAADIPPA